jgi:hypothetical protein
MSRKRYRMFSVVVAIACLAALPSCGNDNKLVSVEVQPSAAFFLTPASGGTIKLTALGTYIHPPATKDISNKVTWTSDIPGLVTVDQTGAVATSGNGSCGIANVTASFFTSANNPAGNVLRGSATVTVHDSAVPACP